MQPNVQRWLTSFVIVVASAPAPAGDRDWPVERGFAKPKVEFRAEMVRSAPAGYLQDAAACYLYSGTHHTLDRDGTLHAATQELIRLNTRRGIDQMGEFRSIAFNPHYEKVVLHLARVHKAAGPIEGTAAPALSRSPIHARCPAPEEGAPGRAGRAAGPPE
jgi:hypothetical protein